jgi:hypothetical protein
MAGGRLSCFLWSKFSGEKGSVGLCIVVMQHPVLLSPKFGVNFSYIFTQSSQNVTVICRIDCMAYENEFFVSNPFDIKENDAHVLDFSLHLTLHFSVSVNLDFPCTAHFLPRTLV